MKLIAVRDYEVNAFVALNFQDILTYLEADLKERFPGQDSHVARRQSATERSQYRVGLYVPSRNDPSLREKVSVTLEDRAIATLIYRGQFEVIAKMLENRISMHEKRAYI